MLTRFIERLRVPTIAQGNKAIPYLPKFKQARVISVYDGDTITIARKTSIWWRSTIHSYKVRLSGIDCPEIRGSLPEEKEYALKAKSIVENLVLNQVVKLDIKGFDKYGRILAIILVNEINLSEHLLSIGLAVPYHGKTKIKVDWKGLYTSKSLSFSDKDSQTIKL